MVDVVPDELSIAEKEADDPVPTGDASGVDGLDEVPLDRSQDSDIFGAADPRDWDW